MHRAIYFFFKLKFELFTLRGQISGFTGYKCRKFTQFATKSSIIELVNIMNPVLLNNLTVMGLVRQTTLLLFPSRPQFDQGLQSRRRGSLHTLIDVSPAMGN